MVANDFHWMRRHVIQQLIYPCRRLICWIGLLLCNFAEVHEYGEIHRSPVIQKTPNNLLHSFLPLLLQSLAFVGSGWVLRLIAVSYDGWWIGGVLFAYGGGVVVTRSCFLT